MISDVNGRFLLCYDGTAILILVTILHFTESILVWISGSVQQISVYFRSKKGTLTAKTQLRMCWPVPLALPVPILENASVDVPIGYFVMPEWWPLLGVVENMESAVIYQLMPVLAMIGYCDFAEQGNERKQTHKSSILLFLYSITLGALILISKDVPYMYCAAVLFSVLGHEGILWLGRIPMRKYVHTKKEQGFAKFISKKW